MTSKSITDYPNAPDRESSTRDYANRFQGEVGKWFLEHQSGATRSLLNGPAMQILDVGGGHGQNIETLDALGHDITVLGSTDSCTDLIDAAIKNNTISYKAGDFLHLPFEDNSFDVVISYRTLSHMDSTEAFIGELCRVSRELVLVDYPTRISFNAFYRLLFAAKKRVEKNTREFNTYYTSQVKRHFAQNGYELRKCEHQFFLPMALHRSLGSRGISNASEKVFAAVGLTRLFGSPIIACFQSRRES